MERLMVELKYITYGKTQMICETKYNFCLDKRFLVPLFTASCRFWYIWRQILSQSALVLQTLINRNVFCSQIYSMLVKVDNFSCSEWNLILKCVRGCKREESEKWQVLGFKGCRWERNHSEISLRESLQFFYHTARSWSCLPDQCIDELNRMSKAQNTSSIAHRAWSVQ